MGFFSGGKSWNTSDTYSGLRGTNYFDSLASRTPGDYNFGMNTIRGRVADSNPLGLTANGLTNAQNAAFNTLGKQMFGDVSSNYASRGFLSPDNISGVIGSSLQQVAPQLMGQIYQNQMGNQSVMSDRFAALNSLLNSGQGLLGSYTHSAGNTTSGGLGYGLLSSAGGGAGAGAGQALGAKAAMALMA